MKKPVLFLAATAFFLSCTHQREELKKAIPIGKLTIESPTSGAVQSLSDSIVVKALAISNEVIHGYDIKIRKSNDTATFFSVHNGDHNDTLHFTEKWKPVFAEPANLEAEVTVILDHDGNIITKKVPFRIE